MTNHAVLAMTTHDREPAATEPPCVPPAIRRRCPRGPGDRERALILKQNVEAVAPRAPLNEDGAAALPVADITEPDVAAELDAAYARLLRFEQEAAATRRQLAAEADCRLAAIAAERDDARVALAAAKERARLQAVDAQAASMLATELQEKARHAAARADKAEEIIRRLKMMPGLQGHLLRWLAAEILLDCADHRVVLGHTWHCDVGVSAFAYYRRGSVQHVALRPRLLSPAAVLIESSPEMRWCRGWANVSRPGVGVAEDANAGEMRSMLRNNRCDDDRGARMVKRGSPAPLKAVSRCRNRHRRHAMRALGASASTGPATPRRG